MGRGRQRWGDKMGPDHGSSYRSDKAGFCVIGRGEPLQASLFQANQFANPCLRRLIG